jgi:hypothetical protein
MKMTLTWALVAIFLLHPLPYVSMQGYDEWREFDCGPAADAAIIAAYTGDAVPAHLFYTELGAVDHPQRPGFVSQWLIRRGVPNRFSLALTPERLADLAQDRPVIVGMPGHWETVIGHADGAWLIIDPWEKTQTVRLLSDEELSGLWNGVAIWPMEPLWSKSSAFTDQREEGQ